MQAFHPGTGMTLEFPDNTPDEAIQQHFQNAQANMPNTAPSVAQQFLDGARGAYEQQQTAPAPVNGRGFIGLDPQQAQFMLQQRQNQAAMQQQAASDAARNRLQQQQLMQQSLEREKDRAQTLKLRQQELKNIIQEKKILAEQAKHKAEIDSDTKIIESEEQTRRKELDYMNKWVNVPAGGSSFNPYSGETVQGPERQFAPRAEPRPASNTQRDYVEQGQDGQYYNVHRTYSPEGIMLSEETSANPVRPPAGAAGSGLNDYQVLGMIQNERKAIDAQQSAALVEEGEPGYIPPDQREEIARQRVMSRIQQVRGGGQQSTNSQPDYEQVIERQAQLGRDLAKQKALGKNAEIIGDEVVIFP